MFNDLTIIQYNDLCYSILIDKQAGNIDTIKSRPYLCSVHVLKNVIKKSKAVKVNENVRQVFVQVFTLIQNSLTIDSIVAILLYSYYLFNMPKINEKLTTSLCVLRDQIKDKKINSIIESSFSLINEEREQEKTKDQEVTQFSYLLRYYILNVFR